MAHRLDAIRVLHPLTPNAEALFTAIINRVTPALHLLLDNELYTRDTLEKAMAHAAKQGMVEYITLLRQHGAPTTSDVYSYPQAALVSGNLHAFFYFMDAEIDSGNLVPPKTYTDDGPLVISSDHSQSGTPGTAHNSLEWAIVKYNPQHAAAFVRLFVYLLQNPLTPTRCAYLLRPLTGKCRDTDFVTMIYHSMTSCHCTSPDKLSVDLALSWQSINLASNLIYRGFPYTWTLAASFVPEAIRPWSMHTHATHFSRAFRDFIRKISLAKTFLNTHHSSLGYLPFEMWLTILSFVSRAWFSRDMSRLHSRVRNGYMQNPEELAKNGYTIC
jgi:hypothetical protein